MRSCQIISIAFAALSFGLSIAVLACSAHTLATYNREQADSDWYIPLWSGHFDLRDLQLSIGTSAAIAVLNIATIVSALVLKNSSKSIELAASSLSAALALVAIIFINVLRTRAGTFDTIQTWTCSWSAAMSGGFEDIPSSFGTMCKETRFAFWTTIPIFVLQLAILASSTYVPRHQKRQAQLYGGPVEKGQSMDEYAPRSAGGSSHDMKEPASASVSVVPAQQV